MQLSWSESYREIDTFPYLGGSNRGEVKPNAGLGMCHTVALKPGIGLCQTGELKPVPGLEVCHTG